MAQLSMVFLGGWQVSLDQQQVTEFESGKVRALLTYLAMEANRAHYRETLAEMLWSELPAAAALANLRQALANLRKTLRESTAQPGFLLITHSTIQFNSGSHCTLDVTDFTALLEECDRHRHRRIEICHTCANRLEKAASLYKGEFLAGFFLGDSAAFEEWEFSKREHLRQLALDALAHLGGYYERRTELSLAQRTYERQIELDPWYEAAYEGLMRVLAASRRPGSALALYKQYRRMLDREFGIEPAGEIVSLFEHIKEKKLLAKNSQARRMLHNWPHAGNRLIGREAEIAELTDILGNPDCRLLTILGAGGMGKSRLAIEVAAAVAWSFQNGATYVSLASLNSTDYLATTLASALGVPLSNKADPRQELIAGLRDREMLIVLDNLEHLSWGSTFLAQILDKAPGVRFIVTSRERLKIDTEWVFQLNGLSVPEDTSYDGCEKAEAVQLFLHSARQIYPTFSPTEVDLIAIARICRMVGGMPLAIDLAAAWVRVISSTEIAMEIEGSLGFLSTFRQDVIERHRSLRVVFDHSWQLLTPEEQCAFQRLGIFRGSFDRDAAEYVAGVKLPMLQALMDKSLVQRGSERGYVMHELVGEYAREKLRESGEEDDASVQLAGYYLLLAEKAESELRGPQQNIWLNRLESERNNLRAVFDWALSSEKEQCLEMAMQITSALGGLWWLRGIREGRDWLAALLQHPKSSQPTATRAKALALAGDLAIEQEGDYTTARPMYEESLSISRKTGDREGIARSLLGLAVVANGEGDAEFARSLAEQSLEIWCEIDESWGIAWALHRLGDLAFWRDDLETARSLYYRSLEIRRELGDISGIAWLFNILGEVARYEGQYLSARALYEESLQFHREVGNKCGITGAIASLGFLAWNEGDKTLARKLFEESLSQNTTHNGLNAVSLIGMAGVVQPPEYAARLLGVTAPYIDASSTPADHRDFSRIQAAVHSQIDEAAFAAAWEAGRSMSLTQAIEMVRHQRR